MNTRVKTATARDLLGAARMRWYLARRGESPLLVYCSQCSPVRVLSVQSTLHVIVSDTRIGLRPVPTSS